MAKYMKPSKEEIFRERLEACVKKLDLKVLEGGLYVHTPSDPVSLYRLTEVSTSIYGELNRACGGLPILPSDQDCLITGLKRWCHDSSRVEKYRAKEAEARYVLFTNGIYDIETHKFHASPSELSKKLADEGFIFTSSIPRAFDETLPTTEDIQTLEGFIKSLSCGDQQVADLLYEVAGYCFYRSCIFRKALLLKGAKGCGKSTYLDLVRAMLGNENCSAMGLREVCDKFGSIELSGKLANLGDELDRDYIAGGSKFKSIVSGMTISGQRKYGDVVSFTPYAKLLFAMNGDLRIDDPSGAIADRLIQIPFRASLSESERDPFLPQKLQSPGCLQLFTERALLAFHRVLARGSFTVSKVAEDTRKEWEAYNQPVKAFLNDLLNQDVEISGKVDGDLLHNYFIPWAQDQNLKVNFTLPNFRREVIEATGYVTGSRARYTRQTSDGPKEAWGVRIEAPAVQEA